MPVRPRFLACLLSLIVAGALGVAAAQRPGAGGQGTPGPGAGMPPRDGAAVRPGAGTGSIAGTVVVAGTVQPARRARVTLSGPDGGGGRTAITDEDGRFVFTSLPPGRYTLGASKTGHIGVTFGQTQPGRPGTPIQLTHGQHFSARLQVPKGGVITGTVLDEYGDASAGTRVRVLRYVTQRGRRTLQPAGTASTDDRGVYRVFGLQPGEYLVTAAPRNAGLPPDAMRLRAEIEAIRQLGANPAGVSRELAARAEMLQAQLPGQEGSSGYAPVYYPGVTTAAYAEAVPLGVGEERPNVDFQLQRIPVARIEGTVLNATDQAVQNVQLTLVDVTQELPAGIGTRSARADAEGRFRFTSVPPGNYRVMARAIVGTEGPGGPGAFAGRGGRGARMLRPGVVRLWGAADVPVDGRDLRDIVITLSHGPSVSGRLVFNGASRQPPADLTRLRVTLTPAHPVAGLTQPAAAIVEPSGRFTIPSVLPGTYRLTASGAGDGWTIESAVVEGQDTLDFPVEIGSGATVSGAVITFSDQRADLSGTLTTPRGDPAPGFTLLLYAADERYWAPSSRRIRATRPATDGRYTFADLPPGDYRLAAIVDVEEGAWFDPAFLHQMDAAALGVVIREGERKVQNLQLDAPAR